ncbi:hypothetical protein LINPERHAP1_LOCUS39590 [Linum perenne]
MGVRKTRGRVAYMAYSSGEEVEQIVAGVRLRYDIEVTPRHCYRAKKKAEGMLNGDLKLEYMQLAKLKRADHVDGCLLKGEVDGMLLAAVGKDRNNQVFPIAWAVVDGEN